MLVKVRILRYKWLQLALCLTFNSGIKCLEIWGWFIFIKRNFLLNGHSIIKSFCPVDRSESSCFTRRRFATTCNEVRLCNHTLNRFLNLGLLGIWAWHEEEIALFTVLCSHTICFCSLHDFSHLFVHSIRQIHKFCVIWTLNCIFLNFFFVNILRSLGLSLY